ncbi:MAG: energy-coupling factor ABC transporter ATP-binding protein [Synergistaceae bacterium]|nr:energy-coupling factor ABC transporter ATP-binding protein [Synergistaceae bacterium]
MSLEAENVTYSYNVGAAAENVALGGVSLTVNRGEWVSVVGHTGSGKSTLAQHLNLLLFPSSGRVLIDGESAREGSPRARELRRKVGLVFQYPESQFFSDTVREEIEFAPSNWGVVGPELEECVDEAVEASGLDPSLLESNPFRLSGGERRRVAIASVIAMKPDYLVLDEPTAGLDASGVRDLTRILNDIRSGGLAVVQVTHDLKSALEHSDRILVLERGRAVITGAPWEIALYLASNPVQGLILPPLARFAHRMRMRGIDVPIHCEVSAIVEALERSRGARQ